MRIAVIEHRFTALPQDDARALGASAVEAVDRGAEAVFMPAVLAPGNAEADRELVEAIRDLPGTCVIPRVSSGAEKTFDASDEVPLSERLGTIAMLVGDACVDEVRLKDIASSRPSVLIMCPRSESELQAEAFLELAVGISQSAAGLVLIAEGVGAAPGDPGHGGSAVILLGDVLAEATGAEGGILSVDVPEPVPVPAARASMPELPTILAQRRAQHSGHKLDMGYPADLS